ncbi:alpha-amylase family glycosyl hydrolase [Prevotella sp. KH2C16]|uniref:alpha-amylase family glycosyl hydrolase n=1 Tax=Prevotella sp. KH2C16 TaxID=1855325 RepID=UPI0008EAFD90|nr:alpha-amylase family glycosyl hydrolase [Prevotella sp. KH2C16]SFG58810.1 alpha-amylase [Prevotella sp. KH2C16]
MKRFYTLLLALAAYTALFAQGWPANYSGVMLQGFYWDSYDDTRWSNLKSQADTLAKYYQLVWVPQSGYCNTLSNQMGYADIWWFDQKSAFGTADELKAMIQTFSSKGLKTIADVVINHKSGNTGWCDFPEETWAGHGTMTWSYADICNTDEGNRDSRSEAKGKLTGASDTGTDFDGSRDLDHTSLNVQKNIKLYLQFLQEEMRYAGFRYDMTGGYAPRFTKIYNESAKPAYSVGEYWMSDGLPGLKSWIDGTGKTSAAFDFQLKWLINNVFNTGGAQWRNLANYTSSSLIGDAAYRRYAVTFVDNHDTGRNSDNMLKANIEAANAYILTMPGTPCIFLTHWKGYRKAIKKQILARSLAGITNQSEVLTSVGENAGYSVSVKGTKGNLLLCLGTTTASTSGYKLAVEGENYKLYISSDIDISGIEAVGEEQNTFTLPSFVTTQEGTYAYFEKPANWGNTLNVWAWHNDGSNMYSGDWPGTASQADVSEAGTHNGKKVYLWKYSGTLAAPDKIIFNDGTGNQTTDTDFQNGGYYTLDGLQTVVTGIEAPVKVADRPADDAWYTLSGVRIDKPAAKGIYIHNGKKVIIK